MNDQLMNALRPIAEATHTAGFMFANAKSPLVRALVKDGFIEGNAASVDPTDANRIAFRATVSGLALVPDAAPASPAAHTPAPAPVGASGVPFPSVGNAGVTQVPEGVTVTQVPARKRGGVRGPRTAPTIVAVGRMALPEIVASKRGGKRGEGYPFGSLEAPTAEGFASFFVAATAAMPNPEKTVRASVTSANKRYTDGRKFKLYPAEGGASVFRIA
jgi:hypothetical protein